MGQGAAAETRRRSGSYLLRRGFGGGTLPIGADRSTRRGQTLRTSLGYDPLRSGARAAGKRVSRFGQTRIVRSIERFAARRGTRPELRGSPRAAEPDGKRGETGGASHAPALRRTVPRGNRPDRGRSWRSGGGVEALVCGVEWGGKRRVLNRERGVYAAATRRANACGASLASRCRRR